MKNILSINKKKKDIMPKGIGIDVVETKRFRNLKNLNRVAELILTTKEYKIFVSHKAPKIYLASRFALKEAVIKACPGALTYHDVEINKNGQKPIIYILNKQWKNLKVLVSLSHSEDYAAGFAIVY